MKLVLIDRDGVINEEISGFVKSIEELVIMESALAGLALLHKHGFICVVITNQSVVGRGIITDNTLQKIHDYLRETVRQNGGEIADIIACTDAPDKPTYRRKPRPGMLTEALEKYNAKAESTPFIGDAATDMEAGFAAGCPRYLVMTGKGKETADSLRDPLKPVTVCRDLLDAATTIIATYG